jgi:hypothetical protein
MAYESVANLKFPEPSNLRAAPVQVILVILFESFSLSRTSYPLTSDLLAEALT